MGLLEISNINTELFGFDEEYFAIVLSNFLTNLLQKISLCKLLKNEVKFKNTIFEAFLDLSTSKDKFEFTQKTGLWLYRLLGISGFSLYFLEQEELVTYNKSEIQKFHAKQGIAGFVLQNQRSVIIADIKSSPYYDKFIDVFSHLPLFAAPLQK